MEQKTAYQEKVEAKLKEWRGKITQLEARAEQLHADAKIKAHQQIEELHEKEKAARQRLEDIKVSGSAAWQELKTGMDKAQDDIKKAFERIAGTFK